jgi:hypothetical protein
VVEEAGLEELLDAPVGAGEVSGRGGIPAGLVEERPHGAQGVAIQVHQRAPHCAILLHRSEATASEAPPGLRDCCLRMWHP